MLSLRTSLLVSAACRTHAPAILTWPRRLIILSNITSRPLPTAPGKAIICFDDQCIVAGEIDDDFDVSVLDAGVVVPTGSASNSAEITADVAEEASGVDGNR